MTDVLIIGAGPAGMTAAIDFQNYGLSVMVIDDQPAPGGRIFAAIEKRQAKTSEDRTGQHLISRFRARGGVYLPDSEVWQIEAGPKVFLSRHGRASMVEPRFVLLATGAQERPMPFPGWQLPGVMTIGSAQILHKTARQIPSEPVWLAGTGPLLLLYAHQLVAAGGQVAGILDTQKPGAAKRAAALLPGATVYGWRDLARGLGWAARLRMSGCQIIRNITAIEAIGNDRVREVRYSTRSGTSGTVATNILFIHDGVVPTVHTTLSTGCDHRWNPAQKCFEPTTDRFGETSVQGVFVAGDGAGIMGARAAMISGALTALGIARAAGAIAPHEADVRAGALKRQFERAAGFRRFVDALYPPSDLSLPDKAIVCRCEEVTAGQLRAAFSGRPELGPDGAKIATRAGMGPCQGRQCGLTLTCLAAAQSNRSPADVGFLRIRPPLKPLTLGELANLEDA